MGVLVLLVLLKSSSRAQLTASRLTDLVATTIPSAVRCNIPILTVLTGDAEIPTEDSLPVELMRLASNVPARFWRKGNFREQVERLFEWIDATVLERV